ncbi:MAG: hypothetical protein ACRDOO_15045 [Actinomadura sp.]
MNESWRFDDAPATLTANEAVEQLRTKIANGSLESWLISSSGRLLAIVTNTQRAMVMLLDNADDPGQHAIDPGSDGHSDGVVLANGQHDEFPDEDTVPLPEAPRILHQLLTAGSPPADTRWAIDR